VPKREMERRELESMRYGERKVIVHEFSFHSENKKIKGDTKLVFLSKNSIGGLRNTWTWCLPQIWMS